MRDYLRIQLHGVELQTPIRTETGFWDWLRIATKRLSVPAIVTRVSPRT